MSGSEITRAEFFDELNNRNEGTAGSARGTRSGLVSRTGNMALPELFLSNIDSKSGKARSPGIEQGTLDQAISRLSDWDEPENMPRLLGRIAEEARRLFDSEAAVIAVVDEKNRSFTYRTVCGSAAEACFGKGMPIDGTSICGWVIRQKTFFSSSNTTTDLRGSPEIGELLDMKTAVAAPLTVSGKIFGVLLVFNRSNEVVFRREDAKEILVPYARWAGVIIENSLEKE